MSSTSKLVWLKRVLIVKILLVLLVWGLPSLLGTTSILKLFGIDMPDDPFYLRIVCATQVGLALLYWFAYIDPLRNRDIIKMKSHR